MAIKVNAIIDADVRYLRPFFMPGNIWKVCPADSLKNLPANHLYLFLLRNGIRVPATIELILWLKEYIGDKKAIEIGAGYGGIAKALGIPATDSFADAEPKQKARLDQVGYGQVPYTKDVIMMDAKEAIEKFSPEIVIASYVPQKLTPADEQINRRNKFENLIPGQVYGVAENEILDKGCTYIFIGNKEIHHDKKILSQYEYEEFSFPWLISATMNQSQTCIWVFKPIKKQI